MLYNSTLNVSLAAISENTAAAARALDGAEVIPVLKRDAYGMGLCEVARAVCDAVPIKRIAVAQASEAAALRGAGFDGEIMLVAALAHNIMLDALTLDIVPPVGDCDTAIALSRAAGDKICNIQLKIDAGLGRLGAAPGPELEKLAATVKLLPNLHVSGAYMHFSLLELADEPAAERELAIYLDGIAQLEALGICVPLRHASSSGVSEWFPKANLDAVRLGRRLYMGPPFKVGAYADKGSVIEPVTWRSTVVAVRNLLPGQACGYGGAFRATEPSQIAVVPVGYGDGLLRELAAARAPVMVNSQIGKLVSTAMDSCYIDVTGLKCRIGDEVIFFGTSKSGAFLSVRDVAATISEEGVQLTSNLTTRVGRTYE